MRSRSPARRRFISPDRFRTLVRPVRGVASDVTWAENSDSGTGFVYKNTARRCLFHYLITSPVTIPRTSTPSTQFTSRSVLIRSSLGEPKIEKDQ